MLIDWFTVIAQIVNFLILVILLKFLLYDRIIRAMDDREKNIQNRIEEARNKEKEAEQQAENNRKEKEAFEQKKKEMFTRAEKEAEERRKELSRKAREEVDGTRQKWQESLKRDQTVFLRELRHLAAQQVYDVSRRVLKDLADKDLEEQVAGIFISKLQDLSTEKKKDLAADIEEEKGAVIKSAFELPPGTRRTITRAIHEQTETEADISYKTDSDLVMGIELQVGGRKISWSLEKYLEALEQRAGEALDKESGKGKTNNQKEDQLAGNDSPSERQHSTGD